MLSNWISVKNSLPPKNDRYLCCDRDGRILILLFAHCLHCVDKYDFKNEHRSGFYDYNGEYGYYEWDGVTHWMPLPEPPKDN